MTKDNKNQLLLKFGIGNLLVVLVDNERRVYFDQLKYAEGKMMFDDTTEALLIKERVKDVDVVTAIPYDYIQTMVFKDNNPSDTLPAV